MTREEHDMVIFVRKKEWEKQKDLKGEKQKKCAKRSREEICLSLISNLRKKETKDLNPLSCKRKKVSK